MKTCITCGHSKGNDLYYDGRGECMACKVKRSTQHRKDNPEKHRRYAATQRAQYKKESMV